MWCIGELTVEYRQRMYELFIAAWQVSDSRCRSECCRAMGAQCIPLQALATLPKIHQQRWSCCKSRGST